MIAPLLALSPTASRVSGAVPTRPGDRRDVDDRAAAAAEDHGAARRLRHQKAPGDVGLERRCATDRAAASRTGSAQLIPALFTRMSIRPNRSMIAATAASTWLGCETSQVMRQALDALRSELGLGRCPATARAVR